MRFKFLCPIIGNYLYLEHPRKCPKFQTSNVQLICDHRPVIAWSAGIIVAIIVIPGLTFPQCQRSVYNSHYLDQSSRSGSVQQTCRQCLTFGEGSLLWMIDHQRKPQVWTASCHHLCITKSCSFANRGLVRHRLQVCPAMNSSAGFPDLFLGKYLMF